MGVASKVIFYIIPVTLLIVVAIILFGETGMWEDLKAEIFDLIDWFMPKVSVGQEELESEESIPETHRQEITELTRVINAMLGENKRNCFGDFGDLSVLGERGTTITLEARESGTLMTIRGGAGGQQQITELRTEFPGMVPCIIAGSDVLTENFFSYFIDDENRCNGPCYPYYQPVQSISIAYRTANNNGNQITVAGPGFGTSPVNDESDNFQSAGWLFTPDGRHICFFPTNYWTNADADGIANEWFTADEDNSIPNQVNTNNWYCTQQ